jgi:tetratricopeptide (TPR) repeat protein
LRRHRAGHLLEAKILYEQALVKEPRHPDALHLLGVIALQLGNAGDASTLIEKAVRLQPDNPAFHANLAQAYLALQRVADAHTAFRRAATLDPNDPQLAVGVANCLAMQNQAEEAERQLRGVLKRHPGYALAWFNIGNVLRGQGRPQEAVDSYRRATELESGFPDAHNNLGSVLHSLERFEEAEQAFRRCIALQPDVATGYYNLVSVLIDCGKFADAEAECQRGLARCRESVDLHLLLGSALAHQGKLTEALDSFRTAVTLAPDNTRALWAYGSALYETGNQRQGLEWLERARELQPDSPELRNSMAGMCLSAGDLQAGWLEYEGRPARQRFVAKYPDLQLARDLPRNLAGKKVCVLREQGLGDELFFLRFAAILKSRGAEIAYCASVKLAALLARVPMLDRVIGPTEPDLDADVTMLVGDLPYALGRLASSQYSPRTSLRPAPAAGVMRNLDFRRRLRVFFPEPAPALELTPLLEQLHGVRQRLAVLGPAPYVCVTWRAGTAPVEQRGTVWTLHKEIPLEQLGAVLRKVRGTLLAVQRNPQAGEIEQLSAHAGRPVHDLTALNEDLEAMLALLALADEYIGVSNTNMHLRAGTGRSARVLVPLPAEWRWMAAGDKSPWFPKFRIYRQEPDGGWGVGLGRLRDDLVAAYGTY